MRKRFTTDERDAHRAEIANLSDPMLQVIESSDAGFELSYSVAIGAIEIAAYRSGTRLHWSGLRSKVVFRIRGQVVAGKFAADFVEQVHTAPERIGTLRGLDTSVIHQ